MQRSSKAAITVFIVALIAVWAWLTQLELKAPAILFASLQSAAILLAAFLLRNAKVSSIVGMLLSALSGWLISFFVSVALEWGFSPQFMSAIDQQVRSGDIYSQLYGWFIASVMYLGILQAPLVFYSLPKLNVRPGDV